MLGTHSHKPLRIAPLSTLFVICTQRLSMFYLCHNYTALPSLLASFIGSNTLGYVIPDVVVKEVVVIVVKAGRPEEIDHGNEGDFGIRHNHSAPVSPSQDCRARIIGSALLEATPIVLGAVLRQPQLLHIPRSFHKIKKCCKKEI